MDKDQALPRNRLNTLKEINIDGQDESGCNLRRSGGNSSGEEEILVPGRRAMFATLLFFRCRPLRSDPRVLTADCL